MNATSPPGASRRPAISEYREKQMALTSTKPYVAVPRDLVENFNGKQIVYVCWDHHMLFATPLLLVVEPEMSFGDLLENVVKPLIGPDPDAAAVRSEEHT